MIERITIHGLANERDFLAAFICELSALGKQVIGVPALLGATRRGNHAIRAELIAANLDAHEGLEGRRPHGGIAGRIETLEAGGDGLLAAVGPAETQCILGHSRFLHLRDQFRNARELPGADDHVHVRGPATDFLLVLLRHAAEYADDRFGMLLLVLRKPAKGGVGFLLRMFAHGTCGEENDIRGRRLVHEFVALTAQTADDQLAIEHVHLAANGFNEESFRAIVHDRFRGTGYKPGPDKGSYKFQVTRFKLRVLTGCFLQKFAVVTLRTIITPPPQIDPPLSTDDLAETPRPSFASCLRAAARES